MKLIDMAGDTFLSIGTYLLRVSSIEVIYPSHNWDGQAVIVFLLTSKAKILSVEGDLKECLDLLKNLKRKLKTD